MRSRALGLVAPLLLQRHVSALQVAPNSPCAASCIDDSGLDVSDPNSSNTYSSDITCLDQNFAGSPTGQKWQQCMSCLQKSTFSQGTESDQGWFLYNLRYNFDYCIFGFPNASDVGSSPCQTSTACGGLQTALEDGDLDPNNLAEYGYCSANGSAMTTSTYGNCLDCIRASGNNNYMANALVALEAGCLQQPPAGKVVGLNESIFSGNLISIVNPASLSGPAAGGSGPHLATTTVAIIAVAAVVGLAAAAAVGYICYRKRRARRGRNGGSAGGRGHRPQSSLSFRCQTHLSPRSPRFFPTEESIDEMAYTPTDSPLREHAGITSTRASRANPWKPHNSVASFHTTISSSTAPAPAPQKNGITITNPSTVALRQLSTSIPAAPASVHHYNQSPSTSTMRGSPVFTTPTSTTGLLPSPRASSFARYVPSEHGVASGAWGSPVVGTGDANPYHPNPNPNPNHASPPLPQYNSPLSASSASPLLRQYGWGEAVAMPPPVPKASGNTASGTSGDLKKKKSRESGSPVESHQIQLSFPPPPPPRR